MRLKKITQELKTVLEESADKKRRARKIDKLVSELEKKKKKYQANIKNTEDAAKELGKKIEFCEAQLNKGKNALKPGPTKSAPTTKNESSVGNDRSAADRIEKSKKVPPKITSSARRVQH